MISVSLSYIYWIKYVSKKLFSTIQMDYSYNLNMEAQNRTSPVFLWLTLWTILIRYSDHGLNTRPKTGHNVWFTDIFSAIITLEMSEIQISVHIQTPSNIATRHIFTIHIPDNSSIQTVTELLDFIHTVVCCGN